MKWLSKKISRTSKSVLLSSLLSVGVFGQTPEAPGKLVSSDRYLMKILDRTLSLQDVGYQHRNLKALGCLYDDAVIIRYFGKNFAKDLEKFEKNIPKDSAGTKSFLRGNEELLKNLRFFFKMLWYAEDQKSLVSPNLTNVIREATKENQCGTEILYKDTLKTNFLSLLRLELYLRSRYGGQLKTAKTFEAVKPSIDLFVESLDKQFPHEYYW